MKYFEFVPDGTQDCKVTACLHASETFSEMTTYSYARPVMIVCPGGGYGMVSQREAEPVAKCYFAAGYDTFILWYSVKSEAVNFKPLCQLASTIAHIRKYADEWHIDKSKIAVSGFSAGGHLACSLGTLFNEEHFLKIYNCKDDIRPNAMVLAYPVITSDEYAHIGSIQQVSGATVGTEEYQWFGLDGHVDKETPPTFLWHTAEDTVVPVENSLQMAKALSACKVPYELHIFPNGPHGMSVCTKEVNTSCEYNGRWVEWSIKWLNKLFGFEI